MEDATESREFVITKFDWEKMRSVPVNSKAKKVFTDLDEAVREATRLNNLPQNRKQFLMVDLASAFVKRLKCAA